MNIIYIYIYVCVLVKSHVLEYVVNLFGSIYFWLNGELMNTNILGNISIFVGCAFFMAP